MTLDDKIAMARQLLWRDANDDSAKVGAVVEAHQWLVALEAAKAIGEPEQRWNVDLKGWPLNNDELERQRDAARQANEDNAKASYDRLDELNRD